jgi:Uncharacterized conserved protein
MSGHSKWHNIQGRKNAQDAKRGKIFQKYHVTYIKPLKQVILIQQTTLNFVW